MRHLVSILLWVGVIAIIVIVRKRRAARAQVEARGTTTVAPTRSSGAAPFDDAELAPLVGALREIKAKALDGSGAFATARSGRLAIHIALTREETGWTYRVGATATGEFDDVARLYLLGFVVGNLQIPLNEAAVVYKGDDEGLTLQLPVPHSKHAEWVTALTWTSPPGQYTADLRLPRQIADATRMMLERFEVVPVTTLRF